MRLSELGEFGLLAELERRGLVRGQDAEGAVLADGVVVTQDTLVEGVHFRREWTSWRDLGYKAAAVNLSDLAALGAEPEALLVALGAAAETRRRTQLVELYEGLNEPGVPVAGGDTTRAEHARPHGHGRRPERARAGPRGRRARATCWSSRARSAARPPVSTRSARAWPASTSWSSATAGRRSGWRRAGGWPRSPTRSSTSRTGSPATRPGSPSARAAGSCSTRRASRARRGSRRSADLPFWTLGEDYELLAALAPEDAGALGFPVVGRCEEGSGVEPADLAGWDSFRPPGLSQRSQADS